MHSSNPPTPQAAASAIVEQDGRLLLVKRRNPPAADLYAFPGGRSEPGETPEETALRELFEETGIRGHSPTLFAVYDLKGESDAPGQSTHFFLSVFRVEMVERGEVMAADDALEAGWFAVEDIPLLPVPASVLECVERLSDELSGRRP
ncbi:NUDIX hydrolase [Ciceribacter sp. L1K22]|uniref:NUDIX hydrolase n=1 Tax=Ciceribacter sp. L1K22 TaxID=2820275 RepID=UPI001ABE0DA2|nr:NUDIX hydrolase [Ciceribacter sp. L1K22]MBO3759646.1 NUDIX hydrolase [Ciceribacter sp. L1K22]